MGFHGQALTPLIDQLAGATDRTGRRLAESFQKTGERNTEINTPVETYHLRRSYKRTPIDYKQLAALAYTSIRWSAYAWEGRVFTEVEYAPFVELGTGLWGPKRAKYIIKPKKPGGVLRFTPYERMPNGGVVLDVQGAPTKGGLIYVRFVTHPGSPGAHMFRIGATLTEHEYQEWSREPLRLWKTEVENRLAHA